MHQGEACCPRGLRKRWPEAARSPPEPKRSFHRAHLRHAEALDTVTVIDGVATAPIFFKTSRRQRRYPMNKAQLNTGAQSLSDRTRQSPSSGR